MDKLVSPYIDTEQYTKISLHPYQMTNDVNINLKINLKKKVEKNVIKMVLLVKYIEL